MAVVQAHILPSLPFVFGFQNSNSGIRRTGRIHFASSYPDCSSFPVYRDITHILRRRRIHNRRKTHSIIIRVPKSARSISYIKFGWIFRIYIHIYHSPTHHSWPHIFESNLLKNRLIFHYFLSFQ